MPTLPENNGQDDDAAGSDVRLPRRLLTPWDTGIPGLSSSEIDEALARIDEWVPEDSPGLRRSGFSVFSATLPQSPSYQSVHCSPVPTVVGGSIGENPSIQAYDTPSSISTQCMDQGNPTTESSTDVDSQCTAPGYVAVPSDTVVTGQPLGQDTITGVLSASDEPFEVGRMGETTTPVRSPATETPNKQTMQSPPKPPRHLDELFMPMNQKRLIHHWVTFTSRRLVLLDEPHNPCRTLMLPMALAGLTSRSAASNSHVAIFHAVCACAAYNLYELGARAGEDDLSLALAHDQQAIRHLRHNLARADEHRDASFAMAIMACVAVEAVSGTTRRWRTHVSGGLAYLARLHSRGDVDEAVLAPFRRHMVLMAILCDFSPSESLEFSFPYYGVSRSFLRAHARMNVFAAAESGTSSSLSDELSRQLDAFELQLYLAFPSPSRYQMDGGSQLHATIIQHVSTSYYYAGLVYFQRSIRQAPVASVQTLVELGVAELEAIDRVGKGERGCMMLWPVLVLGAECDEPKVQQRVRDWFRGQKKLGFRNLVVLEDLIAHVWQVRTAGTSSSGDHDDAQEKAAHVDWREIIALPRNGRVRRVEIPRQGLAVRATSSSPDGAEVVLAIIIIALRGGLLGVLVVAEGEGGRPGKRGQARRGPAHELRQVRRAQHLGLVLSARQQVVEVVLLALARAGGGLERRRALAVQVIVGVAAGTGHDVARAADLGDAILDFVALALAVSTLGHGSWFIPGLDGMGLADSGDSSSRCNGCKVSGISDGPDCG
ncbi:fungal-specific transcription factor domain-containing protein [Apiospora phragmitis]|uniref:Fungal-specific transcription factor domain-containing protein n=1 Tax=Apiospora phragmitis TaxID=2905665 RepID=A0ABR1T3X8_9PEZI